MQSTRCKTYTLFRQILLIVNQVLVCCKSRRSPQSPRQSTQTKAGPILPVLLAIRIYALYQRSKAVLTFMLMSGAVLSGIACVRPITQLSLRNILSPNPLQFVMFGQRSQVSKGTSGCHTGLSKPTYVANQNSSSGAMALLTQIPTSSVVPCVRMLASPALLQFLKMLFSSITLLWGF